MSFKYYNTFHNDIDLDNEDCGITIDNDNDDDNENDNLRDNSMNLWKNFLTTRTLSTDIPELPSNFIGDNEELNEGKVEEKVEGKVEKEEEKVEKEEGKVEGKQEEKVDKHKVEIKKNIRKVKTDSLEDIESDIENEIDDVDTDKLDIREYLDLIYRKLIDIDYKVGNKKNIKDVILEKCRIDFIIAKQYLHIKDLYGDILLFKEIYINHVKRNQYPIKFGKNKKLQYWKDGQWNDDNKDCAYLEHVISKNIQSCYIAVVNDETISREEFIACQNHIYKFNEQLYRSQLMAKIKHFFISLENN